MLDEGLMDFSKEISGVSIVCFDGMTFYKNTNTKYK